MSVVFSAEAAGGRRDVTPAELSGWPLDPRERADFYHAPRAFPPEVSAWRRQLLERLMTVPGRFRGVRRGMTLDQVRARVDDGLAWLREVARILAAVHGSPRLGNKEDPVDELVYIMLARKTREDAYQRTFDALKARFTSWDDLLEAPHSEVSALVHSGGLSGKKTASLFGALGMLREQFGSCTLERACTWPDERLERFLCSLPEISRKSAYCIMMYSLGRQVLPVDTHVGRVLARMAPFRELGLSLAGLDHKKLQAELADLIPPNLRYSLHVNLVSHGRTVCRSGRPDCDRCEVRNFCATFRSREQREAAATRAAPTAVDLFSGAGGFSEGFRRAGFRILAALDSDPVSLRTYWLNHPSVPENRIVNRDVKSMKKGEFRRLAGRARVDVLLGAPPCQGFSHAGFRSKREKTGYRLAADDRNHLWKCMVQAAIELRPRLVVMENVPGMSSARHENLSFLEAARRALERRAGFRARIWRVNAAAFGVPQDRIRHFLVAVRGAAPPPAPTGEYLDIYRKDIDTDAIPAVTLDEAIFDIPPRPAGTGTSVERLAADRAAGDRLRRYLGRRALLRESPVIYNHHVRYHNERDLELYNLLQPGEDSVHLIQRHGRRGMKLMRYRRDIFDDKYHKLRPDRPSKTIVAHLAKDGNAYIHPSQNRSLTVREAARIQSFHDHYALCGAASDQWVQVGNAVPPVLAEAIATALRHLLGKRSR